MDFDDLESRISQETDALILCNPQNPTGNCWSPDDLMRLGQLCLERRVVVLADEIHCDFVTKGQKYTPFATLPDEKVVANSVTFQSGSKTFSLAAMKVAWFHSTNPEYFEKVQEQHLAQTNTLGVVAHHAALRGGAEWLDQLLVYLDGNHDFVESHIRENIPQFRYTKAQGTYLAWLDVSRLAERIGAAEKAAAASETEEEPVTPEDIVVRWLVENAGVYTNAGSNYGPGGEGWVRMNLGTSRQLIKLAPRQHRRGDAQPLVVGHAPPALHRPSPPEPPPPALWQHACREVEENGEVSRRPPSGPSSTTRDPRGIYEDPAELERLRRAVGSMARVQRTLREFPLDPDEPPLTIFHRG